MGKFLSVFIMCVVGVSSACGVREQVDIVSAHKGREFLSVLCADSAILESKSFGELCKYRNLIDTGVGACEEGDYQRAFIHLDSVPLQSLFEYQYALDCYIWSLEEMVDTIGNVEGDTQLARGYASKIVEITTAAAEKYPKDQVKYLKKRAWNEYVLGNNDESIKQLKYLLKIAPSDRDVSRWLHSIQAVAPPRP